MTHTEMTNTFHARREQMLRELASELAEHVASGVLTEMQANEWLAAKANEWSGHWFN